MLTAEELAKTTEENGKRFRRESFERSRALREQSRKDAESYTPKVFEYMSAKIEDANQCGEDHIWFEKHTLLSEVDMYLGEEEMFPKYVYEGVKDIIEEELVSKGFRIGTKSVGGTNMFNVSWEHKNPQYVEALSKQAEPEKAWWKFWK